MRPTFSSLLHHKRRRVSRDEQCMHVSLTSTLCQRAHDHTSTRPSHRPPSRSEAWYCSSCNSAKGEELPCPGALLFGARFQSGTRGSSGQEEPRCDRQLEPREQREPFRNGVQLVDTKGKSRRISWLPIIRRRGAELRFAIYSHAVRGPPKRSVATRAGVTVDRLCDYRTGA